MAQHEIPLMREFLAHYRHSQVRLFRRNIIDRTVQDIHNNRVFQAKAGIKGQCDVYGFIKFASTTGQGYDTISLLRSIPLEVEFKGPKTRTTSEQESWRHFCIKWNIPYAQLRAKEEESTSQTLTRWTEELHQLIKNVCI